MSENSPRSDIDPDHFFDHNTIDRDDASEADKADAKAKMDRMITAQSEQIRRTDEGRQEASAID